MLLKNVQIDGEGKIVAGQPVEEQATPEEVEGRIQQIVGQRDGAMMQAIMLGGQVAKLQKQLANAELLVGEVVKLKARITELELTLAAKNSPAPPASPSSPPTSSAKIVPLSGGTADVVEDLKKDPNFKEATRQ